MIVDSSVIVVLSTKPALRALLVFISDVGVDERQCYSYHTGVIDVSRNRDDVWNRIDRQDEIGKAPAMLVFTQVGVRQSIIQRYNATASTTNGTLLAARFTFVQNCFRSA